MKNTQVYINILCILMCQSSVAHKEEYAGVDVTHLRHENGWRKVTEAELYRRSA